MLGLMGLLGALLAGLSLDGSSDSTGASQEAENATDPEEPWGVSTDFMAQSDTSSAQGAEDSGGTEPDGQPVSNDTVVTPDPDLTLTGGQGADVLLGKAGHDDLAGAGGDDHLAAGAGGDALAGGDGDDSLWGDDGDDVLAGDLGNDVLAGCEGDDSAAGGAGADSVTGGAGHDSLAGGAGDDLVDGSDGNDLLTGGNGADELEGGAGDDSLSGGDGLAEDGDIDFLNGGLGADKLSLGAGDYGNGGQGADSFVLQDFAPGSPVVQITDFDPAEDSLVVLYDAALHPDPQLTLGIGGGATILMLDGVAVASLTNGASIDLSAVQLQAA